LIVVASIDKKKGHPGKGWRAWPNTGIEKNRARSMSARIEGERQRKGPCRGHDRRQPLWRLPQQPWPCLCFSWATPFLVNACCRKPFPQRWRPQLPL